MRCLCCRRGLGRCGRRRGRGRRLLGSLGGHVLVKGSGNLGFRDFVSLLRGLRWQKLQAACLMPGLLRKMLSDRVQGKSLGGPGPSIRIWSWGKPSKSTLKHHGCERFSSALVSSYELARTPQAVSCQVLSSRNPRKAHTKLRASSWRQAKSFKGGNSLSQASF